MTDETPDLSLDEAAAKFEQMGLTESGYTPQQAKRTASQDNSWRENLLHLQPPQVFEAIERDLGPAKALEARKVAELQREAHSAYLAEQSQELTKLIPSWQDPATREREQRAIWEYAISQGYSSDELSMLSSLGTARDVSQLRRAWKAYEAETGPDPRLASEPRHSEKRKDEGAMARDDRGRFSSSRIDRAFAQRNRNSIEHAAQRMEDILSRESER